MGKRFGHCISYIFVCVCVCVCVCVYHCVEMLEVVISEASINGTILEL